jgi:RNA polymerase sigma-70 factor (ECF subfamily)
MTLSNAPDPTDRSAVTALWSEFAAPIREFVRRRVSPGVDPEDVVQDIFLRVLRHLPTVSAVERADAWIFRIARTALIDAQRAQRRRDGRASGMDPDAMSIDDNTDLESNAMSELAPCLAPFVARLDEPYRSALEMTGLRGLTQQEAAQMSGVSISGMKSRVQRARTQLRAMMLRCCEVELDTRGSVVDYVVRDTTVCGAEPAVTGVSCDTPSCN